MPKKEMSDSEKIKDVSKVLRAFLSRVLPDLDLLRFSGYDDKKISELRKKVDDIVVIRLNYIRDLLGLELGKALNEDISESDFVLNKLNELTKNSIFVKEYFKPEERASKEDFRK